MVYRYTNIQMKVCKRSMSDENYNDYYLNKQNEIYIYIYITFFTSKKSHRNPSISINPPTLKGLNEK